MSDNKQEINQKFELRKAGVECPMCPDNAEDDVVAVLSSGKVHLQNDADYVGYCILVLHRHVTEIHELTEQERRDWIDDIARIGRALTTVCAPDKLNTSILGNMVPHLHCHIMPRYKADPDWGHPPAYRRPADRKHFSADEYADLRQKLRAALHN